MNENMNRITEQDKTQSEKIARIVSGLPENEQEKIYYMIKGIELASINKGDSECSAAS